MFTCFLQIATLSTIVISETQVKKEKHKAYVMQDELEYDYLSLTTAGRPCLNNCRHNSTCFVDRNFTREPCVGFNRDRVWQYTYNQRLNYNLSWPCFSNCARFGEEYEWCFVYNSSNTNSPPEWDYCYSRSLNYDHESWTLDGEPCLNDCQDGECAVDWHLNNKPCKPSNKSAPIYFSFTPQGNNHVPCLSRCGKFGFSFEWCYLEDNYRWDYCSSLDLTFDIVSFTSDGDACLNNCVDGVCAVDETLLVKSCTVGNTPAPIYYTKGVNHPFTVCVTKCSKFGYSADWCYINYMYDWDLCHPVHLKFTKLYHTTDGQPCLNDCVRNECAVDRSLSIKTCSSNSGLEFQRMFYTTMSKTRERICLSRCIYGGENLEWCFVNEKGDWDYCSSVDLNYTTIAFTKFGPPCLTDCVDKLCLADRTFNLQECSSTGRPAPVSFSKMEKSKNPICMSNCVSTMHIVGTSADSGREWCYVTEDYFWDWCSSSNTFHNNKSVSFSSRL